MLKGPWERPFADEDLEETLFTTQLRKPGSQSKAKVLQKSTAPHALLLPYLHGPESSADDDRANTFFGKPSPSATRRRPIRPEMSLVEKEHLEHQRIVRSGHYGPEKLFPSQNKSGGSTPASPFAGWLARTPIILCPSGGCENDVSRIRNNGKALQSRIPTGFMDLDEMESGGLSLSASMPSLGTASGSKTPRMSRAAVRIAEKVQVCYPDVDKGCFPSQAPSMMQAATSTASALSLTKLKKSVSFADQRSIMKSTLGEAAFWTRYISIRKEGEPSPEQEKNIKMKDTLASLRRVGRDNVIEQVVKVHYTIGQRVRVRDKADAPWMNGAVISLDPVKVQADGFGRSKTFEFVTSVLTDQASPSPEPGAEGGEPGAEGGEPGAEGGAVEGAGAETAAAEESRPSTAAGKPAIDQGVVEEGPLSKILKSNEDTADQLQEFIDVLEQGGKTAAEYGGAREATTIITARTLAVAIRKCTLLRDVEERIAAFAAAHEQREILLPQIVANTAEAPPALRGAAKFVKAYMNEAAHGCEPHEMDKSDFKSFVAKSKLPKKHTSLEQMRDLMGDVGEFWATKCVELATAGEDYDCLARIWDVAVGSGVSADHPKLIAAMRLLRDRLGDLCLKDAKDRQQRDADMAAAQELPPVGPASNAADKIEAKVKTAIQEKVPANDDRLLEALKIAKDLRAEDGQRKRMVARQKRLDEEAKKAKK